MAGRADIDREFMRRCLLLALRGAGQVSPNPLVGAVLAARGDVVAEGWHHGYGMPHAEVECLRRAGGRARGMTMYVNLEPCSHFGLTPPCADALIRAGVKRVVTAMRDPNPLVRGRGIRRLREAGVSVTEGVLEEEARFLNRIFRTHIVERRPYVHLKIAQSLDGRITGGAGRWISSPASRLQVHRWRATHDAVLVGAGTVLADRPALTVRLDPDTSARPRRGRVSPSSAERGRGTGSGEVREARSQATRGQRRVIAPDDGLSPAQGSQPYVDVPEGGGRLARERQPHVVVLDGKLSVGLRDLERSVRNDRRVILCTSTAALRRHGARARALARAGVEVWAFPARAHGIALRRVLDELYVAGIASLLVEGGADVFSRFAWTGLVDELSLFLAPRLHGTGLGAFDPLGTVKQVPRHGAGGDYPMGTVRVYNSGGDILIRAFREEYHFTDIDPEV